ncbi:hypothetical protein QE422_001964 [Chryseobacterium sp. SORGH_AS 447]|uniref:nuclear transport factor 2 family protein n=1 Tax=Chryseobacterium sp. SORGH_AS_0447 TaxID=3041769 RepID=UPI002788A1B5|nr:nuclear transport factor 2 family protein [Chryseobacterium sp. SORGH_AS_0447]MDQ1161596.1 hypothetical protein [Chryseobacterium sp. SORGH_AS_0447]
MDHKEHYTAAIEDYIRAYNNFDVEGMCRNLSKAIVFENISGGEVGMYIEGIENFKQQADEATAYFSDRHQNIESWSFNNNTVTVEISYEGTLAIGLPNGMKKGDVLTLKGTSEFTFEDDKIVLLKDIS